MYCEWCSICTKCKEDTKPECLILCDRCNDGFHTFCLRIPFPTGNWYCEKCEKIKRINQDTMDIDKTRKTPVKDNKKRMVSTIYISLDGIPYTHYRDFQRRDRNFNTVKNLTQTELKEKSEYKKAKLVQLKTSFIQVLQDRDDLISELKKKVENQAPKNVGERSNSLWDKD